MKQFFTITLLVAVIVAAWLLRVRRTVSAEASASRVHVQYWEKWTGLEAQQAQQVVDAFNNTVGAEKGIWVDYVSMSQIDRKALIATAAGVPPDVVGLWDRQVKEFASKGALQCLDGPVQQAGLVRAAYKPVFYNGCEYQGRLFALPSSGWCVAMVWNKQLFADGSASLQAAGLNPDRPPATLSELDRYAVALDRWEGEGNGRRLQVAGCVPLEPGSFTSEMPFWFGAAMANSDGTRVLFTAPAMHACYDWVRSYSQRIGKNALADFRSGFNAGSSNLFDTPQNPFLMGWISMEEQGTWISAFIEKLAPRWNRWHVPAEQLQRERDFDSVLPGQSLDNVQRRLGIGQVIVSDDQEQTLSWPAGIKTLQVTFRDGIVSRKSARLLPAKQRQAYCQWGAAAWPSGVPGLKDVTYAGADVWVIPSTAKHKKEAFEFLAFASRQEQLEKLASLHCNLSPLAHESAAYLENHPNPYVDVFERLASSPNARPLPSLVNWPQVEDELLQAAERAYLEDGSTDQILQRLQTRSQREVDQSLDSQGQSGSAVTGALP